MFSRLVEDSLDSSISQAKILPLRLHVDQDARDFLERLVNFKDPRSSASPASPKAAASSKEIYLRRCLVTLTWL